MTALINRFNAENPDVEVDVNVVAWPGYPQLTAQMAARDPPDLVTMHQGVISDYAAKGLLEPIEPYLARAAIGAGSFTEASRLGVTMDGRIYGLPWDTHGGLFHVNTALFAKAGLMRGGKPVLPTSPEVRRQSAIEGLVGEEMAAAVTGQKPVDQALADADRRVNELLAQLD